MKVRYILQAHGTIDHTFFTRKNSCIHELSFIQVKAEHRGFSIHLRGSPSSPDPLHRLTNALIGTEFHQRATRPSARSHGASACSANGDPALARSGTGSMDHATER